MAFEFFKNESMVTDKRVFCLAANNLKIMDYLQKAILSGYHEAVKVMPFQEIRLLRER